tara:strand:- start:4667 stop:7777 length:3111 start_codon:yes stop_codon:yes gene_type:complete
MPIVRATRQYKNIGPVGVVRINTGESEKYANISESIGKLTSIAINEMARQSTISATQEAQEVSSKKITTLNPLTGKPEALDWIGDNPFFGRVGAEAYARVISDRFQLEIENEFKEKGREIATEYIDDPYGAEKYKEKFSLYLESMAKSSEEGGKKTAYTNFILNEGQKYGAATYSNMLEKQRLRQKELNARSIIDKNQLDYEVSYDFGLNKNVKMFEQYRESGIGRNEDGVLSATLNASAPSAFDAEYSASFMVGFISKVYEEIHTGRGSDMVDPNDRILLEIAIKNNNAENLPDFIKMKISGLIDENNKFKFVSKDNRSTILSSIKEFRSTYEQLESRQNAEAALELQIEQDRFKDSLLNQNPTGLLLRNGSDIKNNRSMVDVVNFLMDTNNKAQNIIDNIEKNTNEKDHKKLKEKARREHLDAFLSLVALDGQIDKVNSFLTGGNINIGNELSAFQRKIIFSLRNDNISFYNSSEDLDYSREYLKNAEDKDNEILKKQFLALDLNEKHAALIEGIGDNSVTDEDILKHKEEIENATYIGIPEKNQLKQSLSYNTAKSMLNDLNSPSSDTLNKMQIYIGSKGNDNRGLSESELLTADKIIKIISESNVVADKFIRNLSSLENAIKDDETKKGKERKKADELLQLRIETITASNTKKEKKHREEMDNIMSDNFNISSAADPNSLTPAFYPLARITLPESLISGLNNFLSGTAPEVDADTLLKHAIQLFNDESPSGPVNRFGDIFGENTALLREVARRKAYFGDEKTANEILLEIKEQANSPTAKINRDRVFSQLSPVEFIQNKISPDTVVVSDLAPIAEMYAEMGKTSQEIIEELTNYFDENYKPSEHVIDPNSPFVRGKSVSKMSLDIVFPDPEEKAEFIKLVNQELPREFRLGEPQDISYIKKREVSTRSGSKRIMKDTVVTGQTKEVFLVPFDGGDIPQFYAYFRDENNEIRPLIYDKVLDEFGSSELTWPLFDTSMTEKFAQNKYNQLLRSIQAKAREEEEKARERGAKPFFAEDSIFRKLPVIKFYGVDLP